MNHARAYFDYLNRAYLAVHKTKEDLFWATYMATSDDHAGFARAESAYKEFIADPAKLQATREQLADLRGLPASAERDALLHGLTGWLALFEANIIDSPEGRALMREIVDAESALFDRKRELQPRHLNDQGESEVASLACSRRIWRPIPSRSAGGAPSTRFRGIERWVLDHGFLELVALRNRFARALGYDNYFDLKAAEERADDAGALMQLLDDFVGTHRRGQRARLAELRDAHGEQAPAPWNLRFFASGDVIRRLDPYMPFGLALRRWIHSFRRLGIQFRGATMQLDLLERPGKHQNGFCHGPCRAGSPNRASGCPGDQLHRRGQAGSGRQRPSRHQHACSTKAATPRTSPTWCRTRPASRRNTRRRRWPMRRRSRCSATACSAMPTGSCATPATRRGRRSRRADPRAHRQQPADARVRRALDRRRALLRVRAVSDG